MKQFVIGILSSFCGITSALASGYSVSELAIPPHYEGNGVGITDVSSQSNLFAGAYNTLVTLPDSQDLLTAPLVSSVGTYQTMSLPPGQRVIGYASGVNSFGIAVGTVTIDDSADIPAVWTSGAFNALPLAGAESGEAYRINDAGLICGFLAHDSSTEAVVWQNGVATPLGTFGQVSSFASAVNNAGIVAINAYGIPGEGMQAGLWQSGTFTPITVPSATSVVIKDLNNAGVALLLVTNPDGTQQNDLRFPDGTITPLSTLPNVISDTVTAVNDSNQVIGTSDDGSDHNIPTLWENGQVIDIRTLLPAGSGFRLLTANAIANDGSIVVEATDGVLFHELVLSPDSAPQNVPEPASLAVLSIGGLTLLKRRRSRRAATHQ